MSSPFSASWIAQSLHLPVPPTPHDFSAFSTDSRTVTPQDFFVALKGDKFDGHDFLESVLQRGVKGILCEKGKAPKEVGANVFVAEVPDTIAGFRTLAKAWRLARQIPVVAIAGAVGKTTTKEFLAALLRGKWPEVLSTQGSFNGFIGIPITLMNLRQPHRAAIIEIGIDDVGAMAQHLDVVQPDAVVVTAIAEEHLENLKDLATVAREELMGMEWVDEHGGNAVFHLDDPWIEKCYRAKSWRHASTVSLSGKTGTGSSWVGKVEGTELHLSSGKITFSLPLPLPGAHNARNLAMACAVAACVGVTPEEMKKGIGTFSPPKGRSEVHHLKSGVTVLADYYNASPASMRASLDLFGELCAKRAGRRWLFLGDMLELGTDELALHEALWTDVAAAQPFEVVLFGPRMKTLAEKLRQQTPLTVTHYETMDQLLTEKLPHVVAGDSAVIKGSRGMRMERIWDALKLRV